MKGIGVTKYGPPSVLKAVEIPGPKTLSERSLLVQGRAMSVNPIDCKIRNGKYDDAHDFYEKVPKNVHIIGVDGAGTVLQVGSGVKYFKPGDEVFYGASPVGQGAASEQYLVDERMTGHIPKSWDHVQSACLPVTAGTAYEALLERLEIKQDEQAGLLIINGAGGVGSMASQIARSVLKLPVVISTAGRPDTIEWCKKMGSTHVLNHYEDLKSQIAALDLEVPIKYCFIIHDTAKYLKMVSEIVAPLGKVCSVVQGHVDFYDTQFLSKSLTFSWCWLGTKGYHGVELESQHTMVDNIVKWINEGKLRSHLHTRLKLTRAGLEEAHRRIESGKTIGKIGLGVDEEGTGEPFA